MRRLAYTRQFEKDVKRCKKRSKNLDKLKMLVGVLAQGDKPDPIHKDHQLVGNYKGRRECHIEANWLLVYKLERDRIVFERTGTHSDLFRK